MGLDHVPLYLVEGLSDKYNLTDAEGKGLFSWALTVKKLLWTASYKKKLL